MASRVLSSTKNPARQSTRAVCSTVISRGWVRKKVGSTLHTGLTVSGSILSENFKKAAFNNAELSKLISNSNSVDLDR
jgi:hypothetical protein